ncbi:hypothetical protein PG989_002236 [Apiospora arundinis]|uniref:Uncharacterized protein n=1 Tax=Apiospora arundinis TaxID=335852 RepID=A0ABR2HYQ8_9PEZI
MMRKTAAHQPDLLEAQTSKICLRYFLFELWAVTTYIVHISELGIQSIPDYRKPSPLSADQATEAITENTLLESRIELDALNVNIADLGRGKDVQHGRNHTTDEYDQQRQAVPMFGGDFNVAPGVSILAYGSVMWLMEYPSMRYLAMASAPHRS